MRTKKYQSSRVFNFIFAALFMFLIFPSVARAEKDEDVDIEEVTDIQPISRKGELKLPTVLDVKRSIANMEKDGVTIFSRVFNIDRNAGIQELFRKCREIDKQVKDAGKNPLTKKLFEACKTSKYKKAHRGLTKLQGKFFEVIGPKRIKRIEKGNVIKKSFVPELKEILKAADSVFEKATGELQMSLFINWSKVPGRIYVIVEPDNWLAVGGAGARGKIVQTVIVKPETREFYLFAGNKIYDFADQAIRFAVANLVYDEYAKIITGKPDAKLPFYFLVGAAAEAGDTKAVITPAGPKQVKMVKLPGKTIKVRRPKKNIMLPLRKKHLFSLDEIVKMTTFPSQEESKYYFLRQTRALIQALREKAPLSYICLTKALASGKEFQKEIGLSYMEMQRDVLGMEVKKKKKKKKKKVPAWQSRFDKEEKKVDPKYKDYAKFSKYMDIVFNKLTEEYMIEQWKKKKAEKAKKAKEAKEDKKNIPNKNEKADAKAKNSDR